MLAVDLGSCVSSVPLTPGLGSLGRGRVLLPSLSEEDFKENRGKLTVLKSISIYRNTWWNLETLSFGFPEL